MGHDIEDVRHRHVRLWPQLEQILRDYMAERERAGGLGRLLFPSSRPGPESIVKDLRKALAAIATRAGRDPGDTSLKVFRHTYTAARLQTLDHGQPVAPWTVARELGHASTNMIERVYGHLGLVRQRSEDVAYRIEDFKEVLREEIEALSVA